MSPCESGRAAAAHDYSCAARPEPGFSALLRQPLELCAQPSCGRLLGQHRPDDGEAQACPPVALAPCVAGIHDDISAWLVSGEMPC